MKIAFATDEGKTISRHFGRAPYYQVLTIEDSRIISQELREKMSHDHFAGQHKSGETHEHGHGPGQEHGTDAGSQGRHAAMFETIADCTAVICRGMGMGAYDGLRRIGIRPIITDIEDIDSAAIAFVRGNLVDHPEFLH